MSSKNCIDCLVGECLKLKEYEQFNLCKDCIVLRWVQSVAFKKVYLKKYKQDKKEDIKKQSHLYYVSKKMDKFLESIKNDKNYDNSVDVLSEYALNK